MKNLPSLDMQMLRSTERSLLLLPHPHRLKITRYAEMTFGFLRRCWPELPDKLRDFTLPIEAVCNQATAATPAMERVVLEMSATPGGTNFGQLLMVMQAMRYAQSAGTIFQTTPYLEEQLQSSDLGLDVPARFLQLPYPSIYVACAHREDSPLKMHHAQSGEHFFEGAYLCQSVFAAEVGVNISQQAMQAFGISPGQQVRCIDLTLIGSPLGKQGPLDDSSWSFHLIIADEDQSLVEIMRIMNELHMGTARDLSYVMPTQEDLSSSEAALEHLAKVLLYMSLPEARQRPVREGSHASAQLARLGPKKRAKAERRAATAYDRVVIGSVAAERLEQADQATEDAAARAIVAVHPRRGHFRRQHHGPRNSLVKLIWLRPTLVHAAGAVRRSDVAAKPYVVR